MSEVLDEQMKPKQIRATLGDMVSQTLSLFHDFEPIQPTKKYTSYMRIGEEKKYPNPSDERDVSMLTNISGNVAYLVALEKSMSVTRPCEARTAFIEQLQRSSRSIKGWGLNMAIEGMKAVRPTSEEETEEGRLRRFSNWLRGKKQ